MSITEHDHSITTQDRAERDESVFAPGRSPRRFISIWGGNVVMVFAIAAGMMGLTRFATQVSRQSQKLADGDRPGAGITVRYEMLDAWISPTLMELAKHQAQSGKKQTHEDLRRFLELRRQEELWYAVMTRGHRVDGNIEDIQYLRQPYNDAEHLPELLEILNMAAENSCSDPGDLVSTASVHVVPEDFAKLALRDVLAELQDNPNALFDLERRGDSRRTARLPH